MLHTIIHEVLRGCLDFVFTYMDETEIGHRKHLRSVFERLNVAKCEFGKEKLEFLCYLVTPEGISPEFSKINNCKGFEEFHRSNQFLSQIPPTLSNGER